MRVEDLELAAAFLAEGHTGIAIFQQQDCRKYQRVEAIERLAEEQAIQDVLNAQREPTLEGDLDELAKKF